MKKHFLRILPVFLLSVVVGTLVGLALRTWVLPKTGNQASNGTIQNEGHFPGSFDSRQQSSLLPPGTTRADGLEKALANVSRSQRYLWLASQAETASVAEMHRLFRLAGSDGHRDLQRAIASRWAKLNPGHFFDALRMKPENQYPFFAILFEQWAQSDPEGALARILEAKRDRRYRNWGTGFINPLMKHAPEIAIQAYSQLGIIGYLPDTNKVGEWARADPEAAARLVVDRMRSDHAGSDVMGEIARVWGEADPRAALEFGLGLEDLSFRYSVSKQAMKSWTGNDPEAAMAFAAEHSDPGVVSMLAEGLVAGLAEEDPDTALAWADDHLESTARAGAINEIIETIAKRDLPSAAEVVAKMEPGAALNYAAAGVARRWAKEGTAENTPMWDWIGSLTNDEARERAVESLEWRLQYDTRNGLVDLVDGPNGHLATNAMVERAARQKARQDPHSAAQWARGLPEDRADRALKAVMDYRQSLSQTTR